MPSALASAIEPSPRWFDGPVSAKIALENPRLAEIPTIAYSGIYSGSNLREKAAQLGITTGLEKPVDYDGLLDLIERHCPRA